MTKNAFLFHVIRSVRSQDLLIFIPIFDPVGKRLDKKAKVNFTDWERNNCNTHIVQYLKK